MPYVKIELALLPESIPPRRREGLNTLTCCPHCGKERGRKIDKKARVFDIRGEQIGIDAKAAVCNGCGQEIFDAGFDSAALALAYDEYRKRHGLLFPSDIKAIREKYGLSQRALARLLDWGETTIHRYEAGSIQDQSHNDMLVLLGDPLNIKRLLERARKNLRPKVLFKIERRLNSLLAEPSISRRVQDLLSGEVSIFTGFRSFDLSRFANAALFFASKNAPLFKTKLLKLLWYSDFLNFKRTAISLTGAKYVHLQSGPIPERYDLLLGAIDGEIIDIVPVSVHDYLGEEIMSREPFDASLFTAEEMDALETVNNVFSGLSCNEISLHAHEEDPYKEIMHRELISYDCAYVLSLS